MKIASITATVLRSYEYPHGGWVLARVRTEDGIEGIGECFVPHDGGSAVFAAKEIVDRGLAPVVLGADLLDVQPLWERMYQVGQKIYDRRGLAIHAISGVDMAVHDAAAKTLGVPLCRLLGGRYRDRVRVYVSSVYVDPGAPQPALESSRYYSAQGYTAIKYYGWTGFGADLGRDAALLEQIGEAAGPGVEIMLDLGRPASLSQALRIARMLERSTANVRWWEEPFSSTDQVESLAALAQRTDITIAAGEAELTAFAFRDLAFKRAVDLLQPDLSWVGGPTEGKRIAELARLLGIPLVPHNWGTMINTAASIHLVAAMPQGFLCEYPITARTPEAAPARTPSSMMTELAARPIVVERGYAIVPQEPGLGIELDEDAVCRYTCNP